MGASAAAAAVVNGRIAYENPPDSAPTLMVVNPDGAQDRVFPGAPPNSANAAWNAKGTKLAFSSTISGRAQIYTINADGSGRRLVVADPVGAIDPTWSPDGSELAFSSIRSGISNIYTVDLGTGAVTQLTSGSNVNQQPRWSPNGNLIAFASNRGGAFQIYTMAPDGSNQQLIPQQQPGSDTDPAWSPDGTTLAYTDSDPATQTSRIYANAVNGSAPQALTANIGALDNFPAWSPDGKEVLFSRNGVLTIIPSNGESSAHPAMSLGVAGIDAVWAPAQTALLVTPVTGDVTAKQPTSSTVPVTQTTPVSTGTVVDAASGTATVAFTPVMNGLPAATRSTARVTHAVFSVVRSRPNLLSLTLKAPQCAPASAAHGLFSYHPRAVVHVRHGHYRIITNQVIAASHGTTYSVSYGCKGTTVSVTSGVVIVTLRHARNHNRGGNVCPTVVRLTRGHSFLAPA